MIFDITSKRKNLKSNESKDNKNYKEYNDNIEKNINNKIINININSKNEEKKEINSKEDNNNNLNTNNKELTYFIIDQENNFEVPIVPDVVLSNLTEDVLILYSDITLFLKDEYNKIVKINQMEKENNNKNNINLNLNLNIQILDKIKTFSEESFNYLILKYQKNDQILNIKKKLRLIINHIKEYKTNFNLDKYLKNKNNFNIDEEEIDIVNHIPINSSLFNSYFLTVLYFI